MGNGVIPRTRRVGTSLQRRAAAERILDPIAPEGVIMRRAGYADATAARPGDNLGGHSTDLVRELYGPSLLDLRSKAQRKLDRLMDSFDDSVAGSAAVQVMRLTSKIDGDRDGIRPEVRVRYHLVRLRWLARGVARGIRAASRDGGSALLAAIDRRLADLRVELSRIEQIGAGKARSRKLT